MAQHADASTHSSTQYLVLRFNLVGAIEIVTAPQLALAQPRPMAIPLPGNPLGLLLKIPAEKDVE
jgi:hypothetical protein